MQVKTISNTKNVIFKKKFKKKKDNKVQAFCDKSQINAW